MATLRKKTILLAVKLKRTRIMMNFQKHETSGLSPARPYTIDPKTNGGMTRRGMMSNRTLARKYVAGA
jgi:hypothetical protein